MFGQKFSTINQLAAAAGELSYHLKILLIVFAIFLVIATIVAIRRHDV